MLPFFGHQSRPEQQQLLYSKPGGSSAESAQSSLMDLPPMPSERLSLVAVSGATQQDGSITAQQWSDAGASPSAQRQEQLARGQGTVNEEQPASSGHWTNGPLSSLKVIPEEAVAEEKQLLLSLSALTTHEGQQEVPHQQQTLCPEPVPLPQHHQCCSRPIYPQVNNHIPALLSEMLRGAEPRSSMASKLAPRAAATPLDRGLKHVSWGSPEDFLKDFKDQGERSKVVATGECKLSASTGKKPKKKQV